jgi:hypothetical protein
MSERIRVNSRETRFDLPPARVGLRPEVNEAWMRSVKAFEAGSYEAVERHNRALEAALRQNQDEKPV